MKQINYGFTTPVLTPDNFILGGVSSLPKEVLQPDGQWDAYLPLYEPQFNDNYDTNGCAVWGTENALEALMKRKFGGEWNFSERYPYIIGKVRPPGTDPHYIAEIIRKNGLIEDALLPMTPSFEDFIKPDPMAEEYLSVGRTFTETYSIGHEWVFAGDIDPVEQKEKMKECLRYSPLGVAVWAWEEKDGKYIRPKGKFDVHWCVIYGNKEGEYWKCFDSYDHSIKPLDWDFCFFFVKRYHIEKVDKPIPSTWYSGIIKWIKNLFR